MSNAKVLIGLTKAMLKDIDEYVAKGMYASRSDFMREAVRIKLYDIKWKLCELSELSRHE